MTKPDRLAATLLIAAASLAVFPAGADNAWSDESTVGDVNSPLVKPAFLGTVSAKVYDGIADDLLTAGLGKTGLALATPAFANPLAPTAAELRRNAIHVNYRAVLDISAAGGYGTLYGPNVDKDGNVTASEGKIPGTEYIAYADDGSGRKNVTLMVQVPDNFDPAKACIVTATSSGSRGVYGAIGASGEWGLKHGCAVAYTDKGSGNGLHDQMTNTVGLIDGTRTTADLAGAASHFTANVSDAERAAFNALFPNRVAYKHAHSQQNPEADWGRNTLQAIVFAFYILNDRLAIPDSTGSKRIVLDRGNTLVIASGVSNGGGAALHAAEDDKHGLIDGVAVTEPNVQPAITPHLKIRQGTKIILTLGRPLLDYFTYANLYQPCAALAPAAAGAPGFLLFTIPNAAGGANRCAALSAKGLVAGSTLTEQANDALAKLHDYGWQSDSDVLQASHYRLATNAIAVTYANTYGRFSVLDNACAFSFAATTATGEVAPQNPVSQAGLFSTGNGIPPTTGVNIVYNDSQGGARLDLLAVSPSTGLADFALDGAICHRNLVVGSDIVSGAPLSGAMQAASMKVREGIKAVQLTARLRDLPAIVVQGRSDALLPVNHASRAYYAFNQQAGGATRLRYIEVTNAQHFDSFLPGAAISPFTAGYDTRYVPLHVYLIRALDAMYAHLTNGTPLPPSQVVHTTPRGGVPGAAPPITAANIPPISPNPPAADRIVFQRNLLDIPD